MVQLQNNYTSPEQSKRLMKLGLVIDSADCYYHKAAQDKELYRIYHCGNETYSKQVETAFRYEISPEMLPCWSVGRLMEIIRICNLTAEKPWVYIERDNIHAMITAITDGVNNRMLDFSKLEE